MWRLSGSARPPARSSPCSRPSARAHARRGAAPQGRRRPALSGLRALRRRGSSLSFSRSCCRNSPQCCATSTPNSIRSSQRCLGLSDFVRAHPEVTEGPIVVLSLRWLLLAAPRYGPRSSASCRECRCRIRGCVSIGQLCLRNLIICLGVDATHNDTSHSSRHAGTGERHGSSGARPWTGFGTGVSYRTRLPTPPRYRQWPFACYVWVRRPVGCRSVGQVADFYEAKLQRSLDPSWVSSVRCHYHDQYRRRWPYRVDYDNSPVRSAKSSDEI